MSADIIPSSPYTVREGERLESLWKAHNKSQASANPRTRENSLAKLINAGQAAHRVVREHVGHVLGEVETVCYRYMRSVYHFDDTDPSAPDCTSLLMWTNSLPAMKFCGRLQVEYRNKTGKYNYDLQSVAAVLSLYRELKRIGNRALSMACVYKDVAAVAADASEKVELIREFEPVD